MTIVARFSRLSTLPLALLVLLMFSSSLLFADSVTMEVNVGFDGVSKASRWTPVTVMLANVGSESLDGTLQVIQEDYSDQQSPTSAVRIALPPRSKKSYHTYVRLSDQPSKGSVQLRCDGKLVSAKVVEISPANADDEVVVSVGPRWSRPNFLEGEAIKSNSSAPGSSSPAIRVGSIAPRDLPDRPAAYEGVDTLILSNFAPSSANPKALRALSMWVASGGTLVVSAGADYQRFQNDFYDDLLPVTVTGAGSAGSLASLSAISGITPSAGTVAIANSVIRPGIGLSLASDAVAPLAAIRGYGAGSVIFLAFDCQASPFKDWNGQVGFWKGLIALQMSRPMVVSANHAQEDQNFPRGYTPPSPGLTTMAPLIEQIVNVAPPSIGLLAGFLAAYLVCLVPVNYVVLRRKRRLELAWVTTPVIVLAFTFGAYAIGHLTKGSQLQLDQVSFVEASSNARYAGRITDAALFSPARSTYSVEASDSYGLIQTLQYEEGEQPPQAYIEDKVSTIEDLRAAMWSSKALECMSGVDLGGTLYGNIAVKGGIAEGEIRNDTNVALKNCSVFYGRGITRVGDLKKGESRRIRVEFSPRRNAPLPTDYSDSGNLEQRVRLFSRDAASHAEVPILVGYSVEKDHGFRLPGRAPSGDSITCYTFRLAVRAAANP